MTRKERIELVARILETRHAYEADETIVEICDVAANALTDEAELQRSVGEAAIASLNGRDPHQVENDASIVRDCMSTSGGGREVQKRVASTLEAIARALREGGR